MRESLHEVTSYVPRRAEAMCARGTGRGPQATRTSRRGSSPRRTPAARCRPIATATPSRHASARDLPHTPARQEHVPEGTSKERTMKATLLHLFVVGLLGATLALAGCGSGSDGAQGPIGPEGPDGPQGPEGPEGPGGPTVINASTAPAEFLEAFEFESQILDISISSPPVVTFSMATTTGIPIVGLVPYWEDSNRFVRFTLTKLVPGHERRPGQLGGLRPGRRRAGLRQRRLARGQRRRHATRSPS